MKSMLAVSRKLVLALELESFMLRLDLGFVIL